MKNTEISKDITAKGLISVVLGHHWPGLAQFAFQNLGPDSQKPKNKIVIVPSPSISLSFPAMAPKKVARSASSDDPEELARVPLQAVLLADSFATKFRPITLERPKVWWLSFLSRFRFRARVCLVF